VNANGKEVKERKIRSKRKKEIQEGKETASVV
jgi:hypothetical protein